MAFDILAARDALAERSKAVAQGAIPKGRGFEPHRRHLDNLCFDSFSLPLSSEAAKTEASAPTPLDLTPKP